MTKPNTSKTNIPDSVCAVVFNADKLLGVSRKDDFNDFGLPGGKVDPGESKAEAMLRELREETGLIALEATQIYSGICTGDRDYMSTVFIVTTYRGTLGSTEPGVVKWCSKEELLAGCFGEFNKRLFEAMEKAA